MDRAGGAEGRVADALRAQASGGAWLDPGTGAPPAAPHRAPTMRRQVVIALVVALLAGLTLGAVLAGVSMLAPGLLPSFG